MKGLIFSIKKYAIHDGPGIRVTVFMKGCPLDCWWCHNPEGKELAVRMVERIDRVGDKEFRSQEQVGHEYTPEEILAKIEADRVFMEHSGGGVTFSGGEPLMQPVFLGETLALLKDSGFHTTVDTSGYARREILQSVMPVTDLFLYDIKHTDPEVHRKYTGVSNELIISNLDMLLSEGKDVMIRIPVIPGVSADAAYMEQLRGFIESRNNGHIKEINLLPYHKTGSSKYRRFGLDDRMLSVSQVSNGHLDDYIEILKPLGIHVKKGG
jgi:pyruvate formate lyase activating enzyme